MSSTFALPSTTFSGVRLRIRRRTGEPARPDRDPDAVHAIGKLRGWRMVERSAFGFVNQIAVTPSAVLAITVRYHQPLEGEPHVQRAWKAIRDAKGSAALMKQMLGPDAPEVCPVLVLRGPGAPQLPDGHMLVKGVRVVDAQRPELWSHLFEAPLIDELERRRLARALRL